MSRASARPAAMLAALWGVALVVLAALWVRSPFSGVGAMFLSWSAAAAPLVAWSWSRFRYWGVRQVPRGLGFLAAVALAWTVVGAVAWAGVGAETTLDGIIMRRPVVEWAGRLLQWLPGTFGLALAIGGLAASLEARYRLAHGEAGPAAPTTAAVDGGAQPPPQER